MKSRFIASLFFFLPVFAPGQSKIDVLHYKYEIKLNDNNDSIYGKAEITLSASWRTLDLEFDVANINSESKGMFIDTVKSTKHGRTKTLTRLSEINPFASFVSIFEHKDNKLTLKYGIDRPGHADDKEYADTTIITVYYHGIPSDGLIISKNKYGHRTFFADNWPDRAHNWIPCVDDPADKASVEFIVTAPSHYQVVSNGIQVEESDLPGNKKLTHYKEEVPLPTKVMVIAAADFAVNKVGYIDSVAVYSWVFPENKKEGFYDYAIAKDILAYFINYIGPYPYKKLANVQSKTIFGGMENAGAIFYAESSVTGNRSEESLLAHEIAHQWFGDMATEKSYAHLWLSEGFATYLAHIYAEEKYGEEKFKDDMKGEREEVIDFVKTSHKPVVDSISPYMELLNANSYQKGSWVLHMLRRQLGDAVFKKAIRKYYETYAGKNADTRDLQKVFESVSGKDLQQFFTQWLYTAENPNLKITWKYDAKKRLILLTVDQLQDEIFEFPLDITIQSATARTDRLTISKKIETFTIPVKGKPLNVMPDLAVSLLFEATVTQMK